MDAAGGEGPITAAVGGDLRLLLAVERERTVSQIDSLARDFDSIVESCASDAYDDEHDPEGHTVASERQQVAALLREARSHLVQIDLAIDRLDAGTYGRCDACRETIALARLASRPAASTCITCAAAGASLLRPP